MTVYRRIGALFALLSALSLTACGGEDASEKACAPELYAALEACVESRAAAVKSCLSSGDCAGLGGAFDAMEQRVRGACNDGDYGKLSQDAVVERVRASCASHTDSMGWRVFGGPHAAVWKQQDEKGKACLTAAFDASATLMSASLAVYGACAPSGSCDVSAIAAEREALAKSAAEAIDAVCGDKLADRIALNSVRLGGRVGDQVDCLVAAVTAPDAALGLRCGPGYAQFEAPRGEWVKVDVDGDKWGTLCGDGSPYAFYIRLAPEGKPLDRVFVGLQGGGVCVFEDDCKIKLATNPGLFTAQDDFPLAVGIAGDDPTQTPFGDWTKVYMPYCNQDVFAGGGKTEEMGDVKLPRYGSINLRAAMRMIRDTLWKMQDLESDKGWRPDLVQAFVGGWSAGSYGTLYNYHWFLDDLRWPNTTAFPDAGLALDNGELLGVKGLGQVKIPMWGTLKQLPPYCFAGECAVGPVLLKALSPRLKRVPMQQMLMLTNPKDKTQMNDSYFQDEAKWMNTLRQSVCDTRDLPGVSYYITSVSDKDVHVVSIRPSLWKGVVDGESMKDWFTRAINEPDTIVSRMEEANFVADIPGTKPYPCKVPK